MSYVESPHLEEFLAIDMTGKCGSCRFWKEYEPPTWNESAQKMFESEKQLLPISCFVIHDGACHRFPPAWINPDGELCFAETRCHEWCGEYQPRKDEA